MRRILGLERLLKIIKFCLYFKDEEIVYEKLRFMVKFRELIYGRVRLRNV